MSIFFKRKCCCGTACENTTGCTGEYVLTACNGYRFVLPIVASSSGTLTKTLSWADAFQPPAFTLVPHGSHNDLALEFSYAREPFAAFSVGPIQAEIPFDLNISVSLSTPSRKLYWSSVYELKGYYRRIKINSDTMEFDATPGTGVAITTSETDRPRPLGTPGRFRRNISHGTGTTDDSTVTATHDVEIVSRLWDEEEWFVKVDAGNVSGLAHVARVTGEYNRSVVSHQTTISTYTFDGGSPSPIDRNVWAVRLHEQGYSMPGVSGFITREIFVGGAASGSACAGTEQTWSTNGYVFRPLYDDDDGYGGELQVSPPLSPFSVIESMGGSGAAALDDGYTNPDIGCWDCPAILDLTGTLSDIPILSATKKVLWSEDDYDPDTYPTGPTLANGGLELATVTVVARLQRETRSECSNPYNCLWTADNTGNTIATVQAPGGPVQDLDELSLTRFGPNYWQASFESSLDGLMNEDPFILHMKFDGDCPTGEAEICQRANPHEYLLNGSPYLSAFAFSSTTDDSVFDDYIITYALKSGWSTTFTTHAMTFTAGEPEADDPSDYCDCSHTCETGLSAVLTVDGTPTVIALTGAGDPCSYTGSAGGYTITSEWNSSRYLTTITSGETTFEFERRCTPGGSIIGTHTRTDGGAGTITLSITT